MICQNSREKQALDVSALSFLDLYCGVACLNSRKIIVEIELEFSCYYGTYSRQECVCEVYLGNPGQ